VSLLNSHCSATTTGMAAFSATAAALRCVVLVAVGPETTQIAPFRPDHTQVKIDNKTELFG
jgi:hypothetical protein